MDITSTQQASNQGLKMLIYGQSGAGKTRLAATCPEMPLILSAEAGLLSLREFDIPVAVINSVKDLDAAYKWLLTDNTYSWIILDSISEIAEQVLTHEKATVKDPRQAYMALGEKVVALVKQFRDMPGKNIVMTAKVEKLKDDLSGAVMYSPSLPGTKLGQGLPYLFDEVLYLAASRDKDGNLTRYLQTAGDNTVVAKDRSGALDMYELPDLSVIAEKISAPLEGL